MWILEAEGDVLQGKTHPLSSHTTKKLTCLGKKVWLRPGKKFLFGRTTAEGTATTYSPNIADDHSGAVCYFGQGRLETASDRRGGRGWAE